MRSGTHQSHEQIYLRHATKKATDHHPGTRPHAYTEQAARLKSTSSYDLSVPLLIG